MKRKALEKPKRSVKPAPHAVQEQEIPLDSDRWSGFRDSFGEREVGIDDDGTPIELLRLVREFTSVEQAIADRLARMAGADDRPGVARPLRLEHDDQKRRPRLVLVSERIGGVRLSEAIELGTSRNVVPDIGAALYVMRRLFTTAESLHAATGIPHLIIAAERIILTPRADIVVTEAALAGAIDALATIPRSVRLALSNVSGQEEAARVDIARIARVGISMMLGRLIEPNETVDALSPTLSEISDVASIRAGDVFAAALRTWIEQALTIDDGVSFTSFRQAGEALSWTDPPKDCAPSRRTLRTFLNDLALAELQSAETVALETDRIRAIRGRQIASRPVAAPSVWDSLAPELGLARQDEVLQESVEEIESKPLRQPAEALLEQDEAGPGEIDMSEAIAEIAEPVVDDIEESGVFDIGEPIGDLSVESYGTTSASASIPLEEPPAPSVPAQPPNEPLPVAPPKPKDVVSAVASRFGFLLREPPGKKKRPMLEPPPRGESVAAPPNVALEPHAALTASIVADHQEESAVKHVDPPAVAPEPVEWRAAQPMEAAVVEAPEVEALAMEAQAVVSREDSAREVAEYEEAARRQERAAAEEDLPPSTPVALENPDLPAPKRQKRSWLRAVAKQFGMGDQEAAAEAGSSEPAGGVGAEEAAVEEARGDADAESQRAADQAVARHLAKQADRMAEEAEAGRLAYGEAQRAGEAEAQHLVVEAEARRAADVEARRHADDDARRLGEAQARAEARQMVAEDEATRQAADLEARHQAAEAEALRVAEEETERLMAEAEARRQAEDDARRLAAEAEARRRADEEAVRRAEAVARQRAEEEARSRAEEEERRLAAEAEARRRTEEEARRRAEAEARQRAEDDARRRAEEEARRLAAEAESRRRTEEEAKRRVEAEARRRAEEDAKRRAEEEARRLAAEADTRQREAEARQRAEQETRRRAEDEARHVAAEAEVRRLAAIAEAETHQLEAEILARRAAAEAEAQRLAVEAEARRLADGEEIDEAEPAEPASRATWLNTVAAEMGLKAETPPDEEPSAWAPAATPRALAPPPPANAHQPGSAWQASAHQPKPWPPPLPAPAPQPLETWQLPVAPAPYNYTSESPKPEKFQATDSASVYEPAPRPAKESSGPSRVPEIAAAVSQVMRSAALLVIVAGIVGGLTWGGYSYYSSKLVPGTVVIESNPTGADILIDGAAKGVTPLTIDLAPGQHKLELRRRGNSRQFVLDVAAGEQLRQQIDLTNLRAIGTLVVNSSPTGAKVIVDGRERGVTPLTLTDLDVGTHAVTIEGNAGSLQKSVQIEAGGKVTIDEAIFSGWIAVFAPFELQVFERKRLIGTSENERIMLSAGRHELELVNTQRGFRDTRVVEVGPGATVAVNIQESEIEGIVRIDAPPGAEVFIDGRRVGESPIEEQRVPVGTREIVARHPQLGEAKSTVTVTSSRPAEVKIEFEPQP